MSTLIVVGSIGLVSVMTTVIVSLVGTDGAEGSMRNQLLWLAAVSLVLWCVALNPKADRFMCGVIGSVLERTQGFGARRPVRLLQMPSAHGIVRLLVPRESGLEDRPIRELVSNTVTVLGLVREDGTFVSLPDLAEQMRLADEIFVYGPDAEVNALNEATRIDQRP